MQDRKEAYLRDGEIQAEDEFLSNLYERELSVADGTKVGGYVDWVQGPEVPNAAVAVKWNTY